MKIFLSWSGALSRDLASLFNGWLPSVLQAVKPFFSPDSIEKGTRWFLDVSNELDACDTGLLFLTKDNIEAPWIMFEAGALAKKLDVGRVSPLLFEISATDLKGPLVQFQATPFTKTEIFKLIENFNRELGGQSLPPSLLASTFEKWWPELSQKVDAVLKQQRSDSSAIVRSERELMEETLELVRKLSSGMPESAFGSVRMWHSLADNLNQTWGTMDQLQQSIERDDLPSYYLLTLDRIRQQVLSAHSILAQDQKNTEEARQGRRIHNLDEFVELWPAVLMRVKKKIGITAVAYLHDARPISLTDEDAVLEFSKEFFYSKACDAAKRLPFEQVLNECLATPRRLVFRLAQEETLSKDVT